MRRRIKYLNGSIELNARSKIYDIPMTLRRPSTKCVCSYNIRFDISFVYFWFDILSTRCVFGTPYHAVQTIETLSVEIFYLKFHSIANQWKNVAAKYYFHLRKIRLLDKSYFESAKKRFRSDDKT